ncbi:MAG: transglutaminase-like cysteine peptidase [Rhizobiales bacterium]|nr:transglutaminase-like cysteine peptidase [Hyphomicrobiales bacterium]
MSRIGLSLLAALLMIPVAAHAGAQKVARLDLDFSLANKSRLAVTLGAKAAVPAGYYELCRTGNSVCRLSAGTLDRTADGAVRLDRDLYDQLVSVNAKVDRSIRPVADSVSLHVADRWSVSPKAGDCEDFALTKKATLLGYGWPSSALLIALAVTRDGQQHAVLVVRTSNGDFVLDNLVASVRPWRANMYRWKTIQSPSDMWGWYQFGIGRSRIPMDIAESNLRSLGESLSQVAALIAPKSLVRLSLGTPSVSLAEVADWLVAWTDRDKA